jgi:hypothetical protein
MSDPKDGGDIPFTAAARADPIRGASTGNGDIIFTMADGTEALRLCGDGRILVYGRPAGTDADIAAALRDFMSSACPGHLELRAENARLREALDFLRNARADFLAGRLGGGDV